MTSLPSGLIGRVFLVGCPRSGTTLLQSLLGSHPEIISFPETNLFSSLCSKSRFKQKLKLASPQARKNFEQFLNIVDSPEMSRYLSRHPIFISQYAKTFVTVFDQLAYKKNKSIWLEKTPSHLRWINLIEQLVPNVKFVHIIRNGSDVVASLYDVTRKHKNFAGTAAWSIDKCVAWWLKDIEVSSNNRHKSNHYLIRYEDLIQDPQAMLESISSFIGVSFEQAMLSEYMNTAQQVTMSTEVWKQSIQGPIKVRGSSKFYEIFSENQQKYILQKISGVNLDTICQNLANDADAP